MDAHDGDGILPGGHHGALIQICPGFHQTVDEPQESGQPRIAPLFIASGILRKQPQILQALTPVFHRPGHCLKAVSYTHLIYRFRQADPAIFLEKKEQFAPWPVEADQPAAISLNKNFRSRQEVTEGINFLFEQTMSRTVGEMDYRDGEQLQAGAVYPPAEGCGCERCV